MNLWRLSRAIEKASYGVPLSLSSGLSKLAESLAAQAFRDSTGRLAKDPASAHERVKVLNECRFTT